jgi:acyl-CoA synthetase (AMP-forming)/AMP-acid ligase II
LALWTLSSGGLGAEEPAVGVGGRRLVLRHDLGAALRTTVGELRGAGMTVFEAVSAANALGRTGILWPPRPLEYLQMAQIARRWGPGLAAASSIAALRAPDQVAVDDDFGSLSWRQVDEISTALAHALASKGVGPGSTVGLMCRNHRYFLEATLAVSKVGADLVLLNTEFAAHQLSEVLRREQISAALFDDEFAPTFGGSGFEGLRVDGAQLRGVSSDTGRPPLSPPARPGRIVVMTSGTTGLPKGAQRASLTPPIDVVVSGFSQLPLRAREAVVVSPPLFHLLGFGFMGFALGLQGTLVVRRRFDPEAVVAAIGEHRAATLVAVPIMLQRIVALPDAVRRRHDTSSLRLIVCSGSRLSASLAGSVMNTFGDVLYNFYGSTEVGWATIAGPVDLRAAPGTVGRPPRGTRVSILDERGREVGPWQRGRIFVGSGMTFDGYTGGGGKEVVGGLLSTGDTGYVDGSGRLFVEGRDDEMIVSGGENVFPGEVEELLRAHESIRDVAVVGVDDADMGQRLAAFVVSETGSALSAQAVREYVRSRLARFKVPRDVDFVDEIPRNAMGKVLGTSLTSDPGSQGG